MALQLAETNYGKTLFFGVGSGQLMDKAENVRNVHFHSHVTKEHVRFYRAPENPRNLIVRVGVAGDEIYLKNFFSKDGRHAIAYAPTFHLANGSILRIPY